MTNIQQSFKLLLIFLVLSACVMLAMFYRASNAVIAPNLIHDLGLNAKTLGILGGSYFFSIALFQIPMGPMLDKIGPRFVTTSFLLIGGLGAFLFAFGSSFGEVLLGRVLIGIGMACVLMGAMKVFTLMFPPEKFATLVGIIVSIGTLGSILAASPLAYLTSTIGWRMTFAIAGGTTIIFAILIFFVLGGKKERGMILLNSPSSEPSMGIIQSIRSVLGSLVFWQIGAAAFSRYGTFISLQGLWFGPFLINNVGYSPVHAGNILTLLAIGSIVGGPIAGWLSDKPFFSKKSVGLLGLGLYGISLFPLVGVMKIHNPFWYAIIFFFIGFCGGSTMVVYAHAKELFPITISGTVTTLVNFFSLAGGAIFMTGMGKIIQSFSSTDAFPTKAYHLSFLICFLTVIASTVFYAFSKKKRINLD
jgi:MFS family permease